MAGTVEHEQTGRTTVPALYVVATPIGNLQDVTLRALDVLKQVDAIAAEDTRVTARLLGHYAIPAKKLIALHGHNEERVASRVVDDLKAGLSIALTTDAGTPAISDPGARLVAAAREAGIAVVPVPGANAAVTALSVSGFTQSQFLFCGFLPSRPAERRTALETLRTVPYLLVLYEAPHRVLESIEDLAAILGKGRRIAIARELTKVFESIHVCGLGEAATWIGADANRLKGEFVLIVEGAEQAERDEVLAQARRTLEILLEELPVKQAAQLAARISGARRNEVYRMALELKRDPEA
jgi:16S rRNA (cytidine1402-2'-O)-methyltransferase